jgi:hypothetical protein
MALAVGATGAAAEATSAPTTTIPPTSNAPQTRNRLINAVITIKRLTPDAYFY